MRGGGGKIEGRVRGEENEGRWKGG